MADTPNLEQDKDQYKEKFRPTDTALEQEVDAALAGMSVEELYAFNKPQPVAPANGRRCAAVRRRGRRRARVQGPAAGAGRRDQQGRRLRRLRRQEPGHLPVHPVRGRAQGRRRDRLHRRALRRARGPAHPHPQGRGRDQRLLGEPRGRPGRRGHRHRREQGRAGAGSQGHAGLHARRAGRHLLPEGHLASSSASSITGGGHAVRRARPTTSSSAAGTSSSARRKSAQEDDGGAGRGPDPPRHGAQRHGLRRVRRPRRRRRPAARQRDEPPPRRQAERLRQDRRRRGREDHQVRQRNRQDEPEPEAGHGRPVGGRREPLRGRLDA